MRMHDEDEDNAEEEHEDDDDDDDEQEGDEGENEDDNPYPPPAKIDSIPPPPRDSMIESIICLNSALKVSAKAKATPAGTTPACAIICFGMLC